MKNLFFTGRLDIPILLTASLLFNPVQKKSERETVVRQTMSVQSADTGLTKVVRLAEAFKASLKEDQVPALQLAYSKTDAAKWSNFPQAFSRPQRVGISMGSLTPTQLALAKTLLASVLSQGGSNEGYDELQGILTADDYFGKETGQIRTFGSEIISLLF